MLGRRYPLAPTPGVRHDRGVHPFVLADRTRRLPPPLTVVWADLVAPRSTGVRSWLHLLPDEIAPQVISMREPGLGEAGLGEAALRLARYFNTDAQSWLNLQSAYDLRKAEIAAGERIDNEVIPMCV